MAVAGKPPGGTVADRVIALARNSLFRINWRRAAALSLVTAGLWGFSGAATIQTKAWLAQKLLARAWDRVQAGQRQSRPWPWADTWPVARLTLPGADSALVIVSGTNGSSLAFAPGHMQGSVLPGQKGNSVIAAHRDTHFSALAGVEPGDEILVETQRGNKLRFMVFDTAIVDSRTARLRLSAPRPRLTLVTCYPFDAVSAGGPLRFLVHARLARDEGNAFADIAGEAHAASHPP
jgi:sortase A